MGRPGARRRFATSSRPAVSAAVAPFWRTVRESLLRSLGVRVPRPQQRKRPPPAWIDRINAAAKQRGDQLLSLMNGLKKGDVTLDRKQLTVRSGSTTPPPSTRWWTRPRKRSPRGERPLGARSSSEPTAGRTLRPAVAVPGRTPLPAPDRTRRRRRPLADGRPRPATSMTTVPDLAAARSRRDGVSRPRPMPPHSARSSASSSTRVASSRLLAAVPTLPPDQRPRRRPGCERSRSRAGRASTRRAQLENAALDALVAAVDTT
ncbi:MAG: 50S ribosomal protein L20 [Planctomycetota bacterium]